MIIYNKSTNYRGYGFIHETMNDTHTSNMSGHKYRRSNKKKIPKDCPINQFDLSDDDSCEENIKSKDESDVCRVGKNKIKSSDGKDYSKCRVNTEVDANRFWKENDTDDDEDDLTHSKHRYNSKDKITERKNSDHSVKAGVWKSKPWKKLTSSNISKMIAPTHVFEMTNSDESLFKPRVKDIFNPSTQSQFDEPNDIKFSKNDYRKNHPTRGLPAEIKVFVQEKFIDGITKPNALLKLIRVEGLVEPKKSKLIKFLKTLRRRKKMQTAV